MKVWLALRARAPRDADGRAWGARPAYARLGSWLLVACALAGCRMRPAERPAAAVPAPPRVTARAMPHERPASPPAERCLVRRPTRLACTASHLMAPALIGGIAAYGLARWDYGTSPFKFDDEGWFGPETDYGGADKLGHLVTANMFTSGLAALHEAWGFDRQESARRGTWIAAAGLLAMELGDGFSKEYGFSFEDLAFDALGCAFGYLHATNPRFAEIFDLRWEFWPSARSLENTELDPATAYEDATYVLAANVGAVVGSRHLPLDLVDVRVGYRVRDLDAGPEDRRQELLLGVGLNLNNLCRRLGAGGWRHVFEFIQPPWLSLGFAIDLND